MRLIKKKIIFIIFIFYLPEILTITCGEEQIDHCEVCNEDNTCAKCEDKYFPFLFNYLCLPCDHMHYGDSGCDGNCQNDDTLGVICDEFGCKSGFYSIDKLTCMNCNSVGTENCALCTNLPPAGKAANETDERIFQCQQCINNKYAVLSDGKCHHCYRQNSHCSECHYPENSITPYCDRCDYGYYLSGGICKSCFYYYINGGKCYQCTDNRNDLAHINCYCNELYTHKTSYSCIHCPDNCHYCRYDQDSDNTKCTGCYWRYGLSPAGVCLPCGYGCLFCSIDANNNPKCTYCESGFNLRDGKCYKCGPNCARCHLENETFVCDSCFSSYAMNKNKQCVNCPYKCTGCYFDDNDIMKCTGCSNDIRKRDPYYILNGNSICQVCPSACDNYGQCFWKSSINNFGCHSCKSGYALKDDQCYRCTNIAEVGNGCGYCYYDSEEDKFKCNGCLNDNYVFIYNTYQCLYNTDPNSKLYGCRGANYDSDTDTYSCTYCRSGFLFISNEKICKPRSQTGLSRYCYSAINKGTESEPLYSCISCDYYTTNVTDYRGVSDCYNRLNELYLCSKATKDEAGNIQCIFCIDNYMLVFNSYYNKNVCDVICEPDSFKKNYRCYKCWDRYWGNPGCAENMGCDYQSSNDQLNCRECKVGYYQYSYGQCFSCQLGSKQCLECHMNNTAKRFECDKCVDGYFVNKDKKCELITCNEYPEVMPGCIICSDKIDIYKREGKCQACKDGYFKTKNETCVHCKAEKNGGPACELCEHEKNAQGNDTDNVVCKYCPGFLTEDGKCYKCEDELENGCKNCSIKVNSFSQKERLLCDECKDDYILSENYHCIHLNSYVQRIPFCYSQVNNLVQYVEDTNTTLNDSEFELEEEFNTKNETKNNDDNYKFKVESTCDYCKDGYLKMNNSCIPLEIENCSLLQIIDLNVSEWDWNDLKSIRSLFNENLYRCNNMCQRPMYATINYYYTEITEFVKVLIENIIYDDSVDTYENISNASEVNPDSVVNDNRRIISRETIMTLEQRLHPFNLSLNDLYLVDELLQNYKLYENSTFNIEELLNFINTSYLCLNNYGTGEKYSPLSLFKCKSANFIYTNNTYQCTECLSGYVLDQDTKTCKQSIKVSMNLRPGFSNCYVQNIGTYLNPIYSCYYCYNRNNLLVTSDTGAKFCAEKYGELEGCTEAYADTTYLNNKYNCTFCDFGYISYYNIFFEKTICQDVHTKPDKIREIDSTIFNPDEVEHVLAINGTCESKKLFTPDNINCYACNNRTVGMVGCKGTCEFNLKRNISLKCEEGMCKTGYIEKTKGVCEPCDTINDGCIECHYEDNYFNGYYGFKRKRRFSCDQCDNGYLRSEDGTCHHCSTLGFTNCKNCGVDEKHDNEIICKECKPGYFVNNEGRCLKCSENQIRGSDNTCINCDDVENGGYDGCETCNNVDNEPRCFSCKLGYILLENNYTCLRISSNIELEELPHCQLALFNEFTNHYECRKCDSGFILLQEDFRIKCFSVNFIPSINPNLCELFTNLGTEDIPLFSCMKCLETKDGELYKNEVLTRITYEKNDTAICEYRYKYNSLENCTQATMILDENNRIKLNCTECIENNYLYYHKDTDMNICKYKYYEKECVVKYCKTCVKGNNYFCAECLPADYEVSPLTGGCVLKMEKNPSVYFKDIFRYQLNQYKQIGGRMLHGPFFSLRGLTNSQINTGHAFLVFLSFKLHYTRNNLLRNLEETKKIKTYCQIVESTDETDGEPNIADFDCIGDAEEEENDVLSEYDLNGIEESNENNNTGVLENSNLNDLVEKTDLSSLEVKLKPSYRLNNYLETVTFSLDEIKNFTSENYYFNFTLNGKLNKNLSEEILDIEIPLNQIPNKNIECKFNIKQNRKAILQCDFNLVNYKKDFKIFSLKTTEISNSKNNQIFLSKINEVKFIHLDNEETQTETEEEEDKDNDNKTTIIVVSVVVSVVVVAAGISVGIFLHRRYKKNSMIKNNLNTEEFHKNKHFDADNIDSKNKVIYL